jgi:hypothetical protein
MTIVDKFLKNISYKFPKGYPDMNNIDDVALLENILTEMGIELNELTLSTHWGKRKAERGSIIDIVNYDDGFPLYKEDIIKSVEDELNKRISQLKKTSDIPVSSNSTVAYKLIKPFIKMGGKLIPLQLKTIYSKGGQEKINVGTTYVVIINKNELITLLLVNGSDDNIITRAKSHDERKGQDRPVKLLSAIDVDYIVNPTKTTVELIDPSILPYKLRTDYRKGAEFEHDVYGKGKIITTSNGTTGIGDNTGKLDWVEVDFDKPYVSGGKFMTTRKIKNIYTSISSRLVKNINETSTPSSGHGYKIGEFETPSETLESRNWNFNSKVGYLGTGYYFYGNEETAKEDRKFLRRETENIKKFPLSKYNLFRADNPEEFYNTIKMLTRELGLFASSGENLSDTDLNEALQEIVDIVKNELKLPLSDKQILNAVKSFIRDIQEKNKGTLLSNRLLVPLGFDGIDNTNTNLDNYGVGSVIFT